MSFITRIQNGWNAFIGRDPTKIAKEYSYGISSSRRLDRTTLTGGIERSIVSAVYNKIANDVAQVSIIHAILDDNDKYLETVNDPLNKCLTLEANLDQTGRAFILDIVLSMFDEGAVAVVPVDTDKNPDFTDGYDIFSMRVGKIETWYPDRVQVRLYNEKDGQYHSIICPKRTVAIIENPYYTVMNEPNALR